MIIDSSALVAILLEEQDATELTRAILRATVRLMAAPTWLETTMVFDHRQPAPFVERLDRVVEELEIELLPFDAEMARVARQADDRYGRTRHPAKLNFGDCIAYAASKVTGEPLLFKGNDFPQTDITPAPA